jgi:hypothetical protein
MLIRSFYDFACSHDLTTVSFVAQGLVNCFISYIAPALKATEDYISALDPETNWRTQTHTLPLLARVQTIMFHNSYRDAVMEMANSIYFQPIDLVAVGADASMKGGGEGEGEGGGRGGGEGGGRKGGEGNILSMASSALDSSITSKKAKHKKGRRGSNALLFMGLLNPDTRKMKGMEEEEMEGLGYDYEDFKDSTGFSLNSRSNKRKQSKDRRSGSKKGRMSGRGSLFGANRKSLVGVKSPVS